MIEVYLVAWERWDKKHIEKAFFKKENAEKYMETELDLIKEFCDCFYIEKIYVE